MYVMTTTTKKPDFDLLAELLKVTAIFRLYRVQEYLHYLNYNAGINQRTVICVGHGIQLLIWIHIVGAAFYMLARWEYQKWNWSENLRDVEFNRDNPREWFGIITVFVGSLFAHNYRGELYTSF